MDLINLSCIIPLIKKKNAFFETKRSLNRISDVKLQRKCILKQVTVALLSNEGIYKQRLRERLLV